MEHIKRMEQEFEELREKGCKLEEFLEKETNTPKLTNEKQRSLLLLQLYNMNNYCEILSERIVYEKELNNIVD